MAQSLSTKIFLKLQKAIIIGKYPSGSKLPTERELAARFGVSRFAVREAVAKLAQLGLVATLPQSGTYITDFQSEGSLDLLSHIIEAGGEMDAETLRALQEFRLLTESFACARVAEKATEADVRTLYEILELEEKHINNLKQFSRYNFQFHQEIVRLSGNIILQLIFNSFKPLLAFYIDYFFSLPDAPRKSIGLNRKTVKAIASGDGPAAAAAMEKTLVYAANRVNRALKKDGKL